LNPTPPAPKYDSSSQHYVLRDRSRIRTRLPGTTIVTAAGITITRTFVNMTRPTRQRRPGPGVVRGPRGGRAYQLADERAADYRHRLRVHFIGEHPPGTNVPFSLEKYGKGRRRYCGLAIN
jgi:hypothetical protein